MRTTLTIEEDLAQKLKAEMKKTGASLKTVVNRTLRKGIEGAAPRKRFRVKGRPMGVRHGINYSKTSELLDWLDGSAT
jgi:hypothetical protein